MRPWLIEVNENPGFGLVNSSLERWVPEIVDEIFRLTLDMWCPPTCPLQELRHGGQCGTKWCLIYDSRVDDQDLACTWVESLDAGFDLPRMGHGMLGKQSNVALQARAEP